MKAKISIIFILSLLIMSCAPQDGEYIVYKVEDNHEAFNSEHWEGSDLKIRSFLEEYLIGKRLKISFNKKYIIIQSLFSKEEILLTKDEEPYSYRAQVYRNNATFRLIVKTQQTDDILLGVYCYVANPPLILPIQRGGIALNETGHAVGYLNKVD